ncbi:MAG: hypothetical protein NC824_05930 [Candidatus Omnitrophica bacterium]|nr:hypothetical protein [Candidatus Omnitrophota bacterium]
MGKGVLYHIYVIIKFSLFYLLGIFLERSLSSLYIYLISVLTFLTGFILRWFNIYPGRFEPLWIDFYTFVISFSLLVFFSYSIIVPLKYGLLLIFSLHIIYNLYRIFSIIFGG